MARAHSSTRPASTERQVTPVTPPKPKTAFPLTWHPRGGWSKKIRGRKFYFGKDQDQALKRWLHDEPYLRAGKSPPAFDADFLTVEQLCNQFLHFKESLVSNVELTKRAWGDYHRACSRIRNHFGVTRAVEHIQPQDFVELRTSMAKTLSNATLGNEINRIRVVFKWAHDNALIEKPIRYGQGFARPKAKTLRLERAAKGPAVYTREEYRKLVATADAQFKAMLLLALNTGMGPADIGLCKLSEINLTDGWFRSVRNKTGIARAAWLWPETREALGVWIEKRGKWLRRYPSVPADLSELVFLTKYRACWHKETRDTPISNEFAKLLKRAGVTARHGVNFYSLRRCVETYGGETGDQVAVDFVMGHADHTMGGVYRQGVSDARVKAVCEAVRSWLFGGEVQ